MNKKQILIIASVLGFTAVALGAFGAHALKELLQQNGRTETFELAVRYHFYHTLVLLFIGMHTGAAHKLSSVLFLLGVLFFSGSLYYLALTNSTWLVLVTPLGGVFLLAGWGCLLWEIIKKKPLE